MQIESIQPKHVFKPIINVAIYARVSTAESKQVHSLSNQIEGLFDVVAADPFMRLYDIYVDIESGKNKRRNLGRLLKDCRAGKVDYVLVKSVSRMYRDVVGMLSFIRKLKELGVNVHFQNDDIDSISADGELTLTIVEAIAQAESEEKSKNIKWGIQKAKNNPNAKINNRVIYGYGRDDNGQLYIVEKEASAVRRIYTWYLEGLSVLQIIEALHNEKVPSPKGREYWSKESIRKILKEERYSGYLTVDDTRSRVVMQKTNYPEVIPRNTFKDVQLSLSERSNMTYDENGDRVRLKRKYSSKK